MTCPSHGTLVTRACHPVDWGPRLTNEMTHTDARDLLAVLGYGTGALGSSTAAEVAKAQETQRRLPLHQAGHVELLV